MKILLFLIFIFFISCSKYGQNFREISSVSSSEEESNSNESIDFSSFYKDHEGMMVCGYANLLKASVADLSEEEISEKFSKDYEEIKRDLQENGPLYSKKIKKIKKKVILDYEILLGKKNKRENLNLFFDQLCTIGSSLTGHTVRGVLSTSTLIMQTIMFPIKYTFHFGKGVIKGYDDPKMVQGMYEKWGTDYLKVGPESLIYRGLKAVLFSGGNPYLLPIYFIPMMEYYAQKKCEIINENNELEVKFCSRLKKIKASMLKVVDKGESRGVKVHAWLDNLINFKSDKKLNKRICHKDIRHQIKLSEKTILKHEKKLKELYPEIIEFKVLKPRPDECVQIEVAVSHDEDVVKVSQGLGYFLDGISLKVLNKVDLSVDYRPSEEEFKTDVCKVIQFEKSLKNIDDASQANEDVLMTVFNPKKLIPFAQKSIDTKTELMVKQDRKTFGNLKDVIFIIAPSLLEKKRWEEIKPHYEELTDKFKKLKKQLRSLIKENNYSSCHKKAEEYEFNFEQFKTMKSDVAKFELADLITQNDFLTKKLKSSIKGLFGNHKLRLNWQVIQSNRIEDVFLRLREGDISNALIIAHGMENGKIVDSTLADYPTTFFEWLNPSVMSINFYSCHSSQAYKTYNFEKIFSKSESFHQKRSVTYLEDNQFLGGTGLAPIVAVEEHLKRLDLELALNSKDNLLNQELNQFRVMSEEVLCRMELEDFDIEKGIYSFTSKQRLVGLIRKDMASHFQFPCSYLEDGPTFVMENRLLLEKSKLKTLDFKVKIIGPGFIKTPSNIKHFHTESGDHISTKIMF